MTGKCMVKDGGKRCKGNKYCRGQCQPHFKHFTKLVADHKMTWEFLELAGEAEPKPFKTEDKNDQRGSLHSAKRGSRKSGKGKK